MCNPSRHFKGREAWTDVVLLVYQMGLYDEKSIIPIQASLPSLVLHKAIQFIARNNLFFPTVPNRAEFFFLNVSLAFTLFLSLSSLSHIPLFLYLFISLPSPSYSPSTHSPFALEDLQMWH